MKRKRQYNHCLQTQSLHAMSLTEGCFQDLLPGIPNDVTLHKITSRLSWRDLYMLSAVSRAWCHASRSRQIYTARVHEDCLETLAVIDYSDVRFYERLRHLSLLEKGEVHSQGKSSTTEPSSCARKPGRGAEAASMSGNGIALYSMRDNFCSELPPILKGGFPEKCAFVSLDGKVYVLGGRYSEPRKSCRLSRKVYVLDLVGQEHWRQCASMIQPRVNIECVVMDGKIFVYEGTFRLVGEVYDPKENSWSKIQWTTMSLPFPHRVEFPGEKFAVDHEIPFMQRTIETPFYFIAQGKLHRMRRWRTNERHTRNQFCVEMHAADENSWTNLQSFTLDAAIGYECLLVKLSAVLAVSDELLAVVSWSTRQGGGRIGFSLLQGKGLGNLTEEICWQKAVEVTPVQELSCLIFLTNINMCALKF